MVQESKEEILQRSLYRDPCTGDLVSQQLCIAAASDPTGRLEVLGASGMGSLLRYCALRRGFRSGAEEPHGRAAIRGLIRFGTKIHPLKALPGTIATRYLLKKTDSGFRL